MVDASAQAAEAMMQVGAVNDRLTRIEDTLSKLNERMATLASAPKTEDKPKGQATLPVWVYQLIAAIGVAFGGVGTTVAVSGPSTPNVQYVQPPVKPPDYTWPRDPREVRDPYNPEQGTP